METALYLAWRFFLFLVGFGIYYAIAKFAGSNTPALLAFMMCFIGYLSNRISTQEEAMTELRELKREHTNLEYRYAKLAESVEKLQRANNETNPSRYASKREFDKEKLKIEQVRMDLRNFIEICTGEIFDEEDADKVYKWQLYRHQIDGNDDYY